VSLELTDAAHGSALPGQKQRSTRVEGTGAPTTHMHGIGRGGGLPARSTYHQTGHVQVDRFIWLPFLLVAILVGLRLLGLAL